MMRVRNTLWIMVALGLVALGATSCGMSANLALSGAASYTDDLYGIHDMEALRKAERLLAEQAAAEKVATEKRIAAMIAASNAESDIDDILGDLDVVESPAGTVVATNTNSEGGVSIYNNIYVNDYASAYARRLQGFTSLTYRMPSSYWDYRYGDAYFLTLAYDPAFYTVMVMGDQVWVEPRYITNMFGSWNNPYYYGYRYGYNPYYYGYSYGYWDYWGWNSPYWGCDPFYHYHHHHHHWYAPHYGHHHHPSYRPGGPGGPHGGGHREHNVVHRPSYGTTIGGSTSRPSYREQLGGGVRENSRGGTQIASGTRGGNTTSIRGGGSSARPAVTTGRPSGTTNDGGSRTTVSGGRITAPTKGELSGSLSGTTIKNNSSRPTRSSGVSGSSNSSSRSSRSATTTKSSSSSSSSRSSSSVSSSRSSSSVSSSRSSSSSSRSGYSSSSSRSSSSSSRSGSSNSSSRSSRR